jgi:hypothetical protein
MFALPASYPWLVSVGSIMSCALILQVCRPCMIFPPAAAAVTVRSFLRAFCVFLAPCPVSRLRAWPVQVVWLNKELKELWPYVSKAASAVIKASVEPILAQYRPPLISSLLFTKLTLGTIAPQIAGKPRPLWQQACLLPRAAVSWLLHSFCPWQDSAQRVPLVTPLVVVLQVCV